MVRVGRSGTFSYTATPTYGLVATSGSGTTVDPWKGYYWANKQNCPADAVVECIIPIFTGWLHIRHVTIYFAGLAGRSMALYTSISSEAGAATLVVQSIGRPQITTVTNDNLTWVCDTTLGVGPYLVPGFSYYIPPKLLVDLIGNLATEDMYVHVELEWSDEAIQ